jgi:hypothetical protein
MFSDPRSPTLRQYERDVAVARPDEGSGFEADPYSPAGTTQRE